VESLNGGVWGQACKVAISDKWQANFATLQA
jgi:hypothetical protein